MCNWREACSLTILLQPLAVITDSFATVTNVLCIDLFRFVCLGISRNKPCSGEKFICEGGLIMLESGVGDPYTASKMKSRQTPI